MKRTALAMIAVFTASAALAQTDFASVDADASGAISYEEMAAVFNLDRTVFDAADTDASGDLSADEFSALVSSVQQ